MSNVADLTAVQHFVDVLKHVKTETARLNDMAAHAREEIESALGDKEIGVIGGKQVVSYVRSDRNVVSVRLLKERYPEIADECTETGTVRRFLVMDE